MFSRFPPLKFLVLLCCLTGLLRVLAEETVRDPASDSYFAANALYNRKLYKLAAEEFGEFLRKNANHAKAPAARLGLALSLFGDGRFGEAEPLLAALAEQEREAELLRAQCLLVLGKPVEAEAGFSKARQRAAGDKAFEERALVGLVEALAAQEKWQPAADRAKELIDRAADKSPVQLRARYQRGRALFSDGKFREAADELGRLADAVPPEEKSFSGQILLLLGEALREAGDPEGAARRFDRAARDGGGAVAAEALFRLVYLRTEQDRHDQAIGEYERLRREHADNPLTARAAVFAGRAAFAKNDSGRAKGILEPLRQHPEVGAEASYWLGLSWVKEKRDDEAERVFAEAENRFPEDPRATDLAFERALLWLRQEKFPEAAAAFEKLGDARQGEAMRWAATARYRHGDFGKTLSNCDLFNRLDGTSDEARADMAYLQADSLFRTGAMERALPTLAAFVEKFPNHASHATALLLLASAAESQGDRPQAVRALDRLIRDHGSSAQLPAALAALGRLRQAEDDRNGARSVLERLAREFPDAPERATGDYHLGFVARDEGKHDEAARWFGGVADRFPKHELAADSRLQQALALLQGDPRSDSGTDALERFSRDHPDDPRADDALYRAASARFEREEWPQAAERFEKLLSRGSARDFHARALYRLARARLEMEDPENARQAWRRLLKDHAEDGIAPAAAMELAGSSDDPEEAVRLLETWIPRLPDVAERERARFRLGGALLARGDVLEAAKAFEGSGDGDATKLAAGEARLQLKEFRKAAHYFSAVAAGSPLQPRALVRLGETHALTDRWEDSADAYRQALERGADDELARHARFGIAWATENRGDRDAAISLYREIVEQGVRDETAARSQFQIGECLFAAGRFDEAIREFIRVESGHAFPRWRARAVLEIGRALERKGDLEDSAARYREVIERFPDSDAAPVAKELLKAIAGR